MCVVLVCRAQENQAITKVLEEKYGVGAVEYQNSYGGWYEISRKDEKGACDLQGKVVVPFGDYMSIFKHQTNYGDYYTVSNVIGNNFQEGVFNQDGKNIIHILDNMDGFHFDRYAIIAVKRGKEDIFSYKYMTLGIYNKDGKQLLPCEYTFVRCFNDEKGIYLVGKGGRSESERGYFDYPRDAKYALYDVKNEKFITQFAYDYIDYQYGKDEKLASFNVGGKITANTLYYDATVEGGKWGYLDDEGKEIIPAKYTSATPFKDGVAQVTEKGIASLISNPLSEGAILARTKQAVALDTQIPDTKKNNGESFAFILANENYSHFSGADYSINDGKIFSGYCKKTLGLAENNVRYYEDATYGNMLKAIKQIQDIADVYDGEAKIIFYFSGLGMSDEKDGKKYILPSDASASALSSTALPLDDLLGNLNKLNTKYTMVVVDAPFNGMDKNGKALAAGRGVKISNRNEEEVSGNTVLLIGNENGNNYSSKKLGHGLLTYSLLNQLKQTKGDCSVGSLLETVTTDIKKESLNQFKEVQKPLIKASEQIKGKLQTLKL